jgi:hypothetical protein
MQKPCAGHPIFLASFVAVFILLLCQSLHASPWTLPRDELALSMGYAFDSAREEYRVSDRSRVVFPLSGRFSSSTLSLGGRYGFSDRFEGGFNLDFKMVSYTSKPLLQELPNDLDLSNVRAEILSFSQTSVGLADLMLTTRYNLTRGLIATALEASIKLPTGYPAVDGNSVTRGDGKTAVKPSFLFGTFLPLTSTFLRVDVGYNARSGPGHQAVGMIKLGQFLGDDFILFAQVNGAHTLFAGGTYGEYKILNNPEQSAVDFDPADLQSEQLSLDQDHISVGGGALIRFAGLEWQIGYDHTVAGSNIPALHRFYVESVLSMPSIGCPEEEEEEE